jgi:hypothetical protein
MVPPLLLLVTIPVNPPAAPRVDPLTTAPALAARIDALTEQYWQANEIKPAGKADDAAFLRRITLDLAGRIPTYQEAVAFLRDQSPEKRARAVRRLLESPEYALQLGRVLDEIIQGKFAGDAEFLTYLRTSVTEHKPWDQVFREVVLGPWDTKERQRAKRFLLKRLDSLDDLTNDTARVFFGVNVSCAKCHNHPLVADWTQDHYYGMASFFNRTYEGSKAKRKNRRDADVLEQATGDVQFVTTKGERRTAKLMFLSSRVIAEPVTKPPASSAGPKDKKDASPIPALFSRREQLVKIALEDRTFFSRSLVNRLWAYLMGQGLVQPVDQMHSANPPVIPGLLEWLAEDFAGHGYDLDRLVAGLVFSRVYQLASIRHTAEGGAGEQHFTQAQLRPLTPHQYALSMILATGEGSFDRADKPTERAKRYHELEGQAAALTRLDLLDPRTDRFQSSTGEALFLSNHAGVQRLVTPSGNNLAARLTALPDPLHVVDTAVWTVLGRPPEAEERTFLAHWLDGHKQDRARACGELVWALMTSAEFRFNH